MSIDPLALLGFLVVLGTLVVVLATWLIARRAADSLELPPDDRRASLAAVTFVLVGWVSVVAFVLSRNGFVNGGSERVPPLLFGLLAPVLAGLALFRESRTLRAFLAATPVSLLVGVQLYRVLGLVFLGMASLGALPVAFAGPAGVGDLLVGVSAPLIASLAARRVRGWRTLVLAWNVVGMLDLVAAVTLGVLTAPSPLQRLAFDSPNVAISRAPLALIPSVLVPMAMLLHLATFWRLARETKAVADTPLRREGLQPGR
jgi:hypothetical protein